MSFLTPPAPKAPPPPPQVDNAALMRNQQDRAVRRGRGTTVLTGDGGLPDLGTTKAASAVAGAQ